MNPSTKNIAADQLRSLVEKLEKLEQEKSQVAEFIRDTMAEAKSFGFDTKTLRKVIQIRKMDKADVEEQEELLILYRHALGI